MNFLIVASGINLEDKKRFISSCCDTTFNPENFKYLGIIDDKKEGTVKCRLDWLMEIDLSEFDVILWADLDDELLPNALELVAKEYQDPECWLTYGNYINANGEVPYKDLSFPDDIHEASAYRKYDWRFVHLRTFRRELFEKLTDFDLYTDRKLVAMPDVNMLYSLLEMCGKEHMRHIDTPIYKYNHNHAHTVVNSYSAELIEEELNYVKSLTPKEKLKSL